MKITKNQKKHEIKLVTRHLSLIMALAITFTLPLKAQVNIGSDTDPHPFSILELTTTDKNHGGLRMPQLNNAERDTVQARFNENTATAEAAKGLVIYNTETGCLEFWNGKEWISLCSDAISTVPVGGSVTIDACVNTMYDIQYQTLTAYGTTGGDATQWQWYAKRRGENDSEYKPIPGATAVSYKIPAKFVQDVFRKMKNESGTDYNDSVVFKVEVWNASNTTRISNDTEFDVEFIDTYGNDYAELNAPASIEGSTNTSGIIKIAYLNLGVEPDADGYNACDFGSLYQWGRITDGHEKIGWTKAAVGGNIAFDTATQNNQKTNNLTSADYDSNPPALAGGAPFYQVKNEDYKDKFLIGNNNWNIARTTEPYFWATSSYAKTSNDPCPSGWHVPTVFEFGAIFQGTPSSDNPDTATNLNNAWTWRTSTSKIIGGYIVTYGDGSNKSKRIFIPAAGFRHLSGGTLTYVGLYGYYWSSTYDNTSTSTAYRMLINSGIVSAGYNSTFEAYGYSVRCIAE